MKSYFAKYIPITEVPKVGDRAFDGDFLTSVLDKGYIQEAKLHKKFKSLKKAQLFLCTRDHRPGDEVYHEALMSRMGPGKYKASGEAVKVIFKNMDYSKYPDHPYSHVVSNHLFKPIIEINDPWVKEGDVLTSDQLWTFYSDEDGSEYVPFFGKEHFYAHGDGMLYVTCPCCGRP